MPRLMVKAIRRGEDASRTAPAIRPKRRAEADAALAAAMSAFWRELT